MGQLEAVPQLRPKYLVKDKDRHGNVRWYVRRPGHPKVRIRAAEGAPEFWDQYRGALEGKPHSSAVDAPPLRPIFKRAAPGSLRWLCEQYAKSAVYRHLDPRTRYVRRGIIDRLCHHKNDGDKPFRLMEPRHVRERRDEMYDRPEAANAYVKTLRAVFKFARDDGLCDRDPAREVAYIRSVSDGWHTWSVGEVRQFEDRHPVGSKARLALAILLLTGTRRSDAVRLGPPMVDHEGWLDFTEYKGRNKELKRRAIPILAPLQEIIEATATGDVTWLLTEFGKAYTSNGFGNWFRRRCDEAGLPQCSAHGLRKAGATIAAENGATAHQLMAIFGWRALRHAQRYAEKADRKRMVGEAMHLLIPRLPAMAKSVPPQRDAKKRWDDLGENDSEIKVVLREMVPRAGIEPATRGFSVRCSTN